MLVWYNYVICFMLFSNSYDKIVSLIKLCRWYFVFGWYLFVIKKKFFFLNMDVFLFEVGKVFNFCFMNIWVNNWMCNL